MSESWPPNDAPNWETLAVELRCPRCGYDIRLLPQPRCPECGLPFRWEEVIAAAAHRSRGVLFDERWPEQRMRAFFGTLVRALLPIRMWRQRRLDACPERKALLALALGLALFHIAALSLLSVVWYVHAAVWYWPKGCPVWGSVWYPWLDFVGGSAKVTAFLGALGLVMWLATLALWRTLRRALVRPVQVARVVLLAWAGMLGWRLVVEWGFALASMGTWLARGATITDPWLWSIATCVPFAVFGLSLASGFRRYLRLNRGWADALLALLLAVAIIVAAWYAVSVYVYDDLKNPFTEVAEAAWPGPVWLVECLVAVVLQR